MENPIKIKMIIRATPHLWNASSHGRPQAADPNLGPGLLQPRRSAVGSGARGSGTAGEVERTGGGNTQETSEHG